MPRPDSAGFNALLDRVCVGLGYCGTVKRGKPLHVSDFIPSDGPVTADNFVEWVFLADDMNPNLSLPEFQAHKDEIRSAFIEYMGQRS